MPFKKSGVRRRKKADLSEGQFWELSIGPYGADKSEFEDDAAREAAWRDHGAALTEQWQGNSLWGARRYA